MEAKATVQEHILTQIPDIEVGAIQQELEEYRNVASQYGIHAEDTENTQNDDVNFQQLQGVKSGDMQTLINNIAACNSSQQERSQLYAENDALAEGRDDQFREDLLKHLAGNIVIKEHRVRYQKEQFDRFVASLSFWDLKNTDQSLLDFSKAYSRMMSAHTLSSHNYRCHKIDANYDDFGE